MNNEILDKKKIRADHLAAREKISAEAAKSAAQLLAAQLLKIIPIDADIVAGYLSHRNEINVMEAMSQLFSRGHALCLPVIVREKAPLAFRRWQPGGALEKGLYGIEIPLASEPPVIPDVVLAPLLAFDAAGHRLGYGHGYYDHTIRRLREAKKTVQIIGVAFSSQQAGALPAEPHDEKLNAVVTEKEILRFT